MARGILTVPGGHGEVGFDLLDLQSAAHGLWSVKSQTARTPAAFRMSNGLGGGGRGFADPTVFLSPHLPGILFADPHIHVTVKDAEVKTSDAVILPFRALKQHAIDNPECLAPLTVARNEGRGEENPFLAYTKTILVPDQFPMLSEMFVAAIPPSRSFAGEVQRLASMRKNGDISDSQFDELVRKIAP